MSTNKSYPIETLSDILNATNVHNIDNFLKDLKGTLLMLYIAREVDPSINNLTDFVWVDDGKHNIKVQIKPLKDDT